MSPYISGRPSFYIKNFFSISNKQTKNFPLNQTRRVPFFSARYALAAAIETLAFQPGDKILVPSYICGVELDALLHFNIKPIYYRINKNLLADLNDLSGKITSNVKAVLVIHYLGFPQSIAEIKKICIERDLFLIEDCAHALLSSYQGHPVGSYGDVAIFSLYKMLPIPNGGLLLLNNEALKYSKDVVRPRFLSTIFYAAELLSTKTRGFGYDTAKEIFTRLIEKGFCFSVTGLKLFVVLFKKIFHISRLHLIRPDSYLFEGKISSWGLSSMSENIIRETDFEEIKKNRRKNFQYLLNYFLKNRKEMLIFDELPLHVCPLFFPIMVESEEKRSLLYNRLKKKGITSHPWWDRFHPQVPWDEFPDAVYLKQNLFGLPIHQDLTFKHLDRILNEFEKAYQGL